jgi:integrase
MIVRVAAPQVMDLIRAALGTGLRLGELLGLRVQDVDLDAKTPLIRVEQSLKRDGTFGAPKSEKSERSVTISRSLVEMLRRRIEGKRPGDLVFPAPEGGSWNANNLRNRYWRTAIAAAGRCAEHPPAPVKCGRGGKQEKIDPLSVSTCACKTRLHQKPRIHDTRHSHVGWLIDAGWDLYAIQQRIGHESIKTTFDVYGHRLSHGDTAKLDALDKMLDRRRTRKRVRQTPPVDQGDGLHRAHRSGMCLPARRYEGGHPGQPDRARRRRVSSGRWPAPATRPPPGGPSVGSVTSAGPRPACASGS